MKYLTFLPTFALAIGDFQGGKVCDENLFVPDSTVFSVDTNEDYKLTQNSCWRMCQEKYPMDDQEYCCEFGSLGEEFYTCSMEKVFEASLISQEYKPGFADQEWYWAAIMKPENRDDMMSGAKGMATIAASVMVMMAMV